MSEQLAREFHEVYERLAPAFGYKTREASAKPWVDVPQQNKELMIAVCAEISEWHIEPLRQRNQELVSDIEIWELVLKEWRAKLKQARQWNEALERERDEAREAALLLWNCLNNNNKPAASVCLAKWPWLEKTGGEA